ncbi:flagellar hook-associated protein 2 [Oceanobacillus limi]|uniref:Flagellar hook-associated protein 2 n=1 Tax=Oceanobacillus limi TaxID=930131 RepID=A0A1I0BRS4_9BACI|nr:flagellar hook-associated protein 2 [Oceanobacillus limi]SET09665.1 flagellar hook-associated protein 2 [Oceanobacillus limi]
MSMRVGGLASGMDIDSLVSQLMAAERKPLEKMEQDQSLLEWKRDGYREIYQKMDEFDKLIFDMKMSPTYKSKAVSSTNEGAITGTASTSAQNGSYNIQVDSLASSAINIGDKLADDVDPDAAFNYNGSQISIFTYDESLGEMTESEIDVTTDDSLNDILKKITDEDNNVKAFFDSTSRRVIMETTRTGDYNSTTEFSGNEIGFETGTGSFFDNIGLGLEGESGGTNATFRYNNSDVVMESKTNSYNLNGITLDFKNTGSASLTVDNNVDAAYDKIKGFVDKYNEIVEAINGSQQEKKNYDYKPLTSEQKEEMSEEEIELWEEKAKSGILRGETALTSGLYSMRNDWYSKVETGGNITSLTQVGINTSANYLDGGKLEINEKELKDALREDPEGVMKLFSNSTEDKEDPSRGLVNRLEDSLDRAMAGIENKAGKSTSTLENYSLGKRLKELSTRMYDFEQRMMQVENRYWKQFSQMEQAISRMNQQSAQLMGQFGGGMM